MNPTVGIYSADGCFGRSHHRCSFDAARLDADRMFPIDHSTLLENFVLAFQKFCTAMFRDQSGSGGVQRLIDMLLVLAEPLFQFRFRSGFMDRSVAFIGIAKKLVPLCLIADKKSRM